MKRLLQITILSLFFSSAWGQSFTTGYRSLVVFSDGHSTQPVGESEEDCERNSRRIVADYLAMFEPGSVTVDPSRSLPCGPRSSTVPELDLAAWEKLQFPPVCLSCPLLHPDSFEIYYPGFESKIKDLYYLYGIDQYNLKLSQLQQEFNLEHFEKEVYMLNNEINKIK